MLRTVDTLATPFPAFIYPCRAAVQQSAGWIGAAGTTCSLRPTTIDWPRQQWSKLWQSLHQSWPPCLPARFEHRSCSTIAILSKPNEPLTEEGSGRDRGAVFWPVRSSPVQNLLDGLRRGPQSTKSRERIGLPSCSNRVRQLFRAHVVSRRRSLALFHRNGPSHAFLRPDGSLSSGRYLAAMA